METGKKLTEPHKSIRKLYFVSKKNPKDFVIISNKLLTVTLNKNFWAFLVMQTDATGSKKQTTIERSKKHHCRCYFA